MEKKNPNIYQRALDIVNNRINPDIPQGSSGGSDNVFVVTFTQDEDGGIQCDRTIDEITEAFEDKLVVGFLKIQDEDMAIHYQTVVLSDWIPGFAESFEHAIFNPDGISVITISYDDTEGSWKTRTLEYKIEATSEE